MDLTTQPHSQVCRELGEALTDTKFQYKLFTDGSGFTDNIGGFASVLVVPDGSIKCTASCGCSMHMGTSRAEFVAILHGLHTIIEANGYDTKGEDMINLLSSKPKVLIVSDRQDLVGSINNVYSRKRNGDLWAAFSWYETIFDIEAVHTKRETVAIHKDADRLASAMRLVLLDFIEQHKETDYLKHGT